MHLVKKYTGTAMDRLLLDLMVQGVFEGANTPDFRDAVVLHRITKVPLPDSNWVRVNCPHRKTSPLQYNYWNLSVPGNADSEIPTDSSPVPSSNREAAL